MCQVKLWLYLPCGHIRWTLHQRCDYPTKMGLSPTPTVMYGGNPQGLCPYWQKAPGDINVCLTTHFPCHECDELTQTQKLRKIEKPLPQTPKAERRTHSSVRQAIPLSSDRLPSTPSRRRSLLGSRTTKRGGGGPPPTRNHPIFDGTCRSPQKARRPSGPRRHESRFKEEMDVSMEHDADLMGPIGALTLVPGAREQLVIELQDEMLRQRDKEEGMKRELELGDQRIKALMSALYDEL